MLDFNYMEKESVWRSIVVENPECEEQLRRIAETIRDTKKEKVALPEGINGKDVAMALELNILSLDNDEASFNDRVSFLFFLSRSMIEKEFIVAWEDINQFWKEIEKLKQESFKFDLIQDHASMVLIVLSIYYNKNISEHFKNVITLNVNKNWWGVLHVFCDALPYIQVDVEGFVPVFEKVYQYIKGDYAANIVFDAIEKLCSQQEAFGKSLLTKLTDNPDSDATWFMQSVIAGIALKCGTQEIYLDSFELMNQVHPSLIKMGIISTSRFKYERNSVLLQKTLKQYQTFLEHEERPDILSILTRAYGNLLDEDESTSTHIVELSRRHSPEIQYEVARILQIKHEKCSSHEWYIKSLMNLSSVDLKLKGITDYLDWSLYAYVNTSPEKSFEFIEAWIEQHEPPSEKDKSVVDLFDSLFHRLVEEQKEMLEQYLTKWLNSDNSKFHFHIQSFFSEVDFRTVDFSLNKALLDDMSFKDVKYVLRKILGFVLDNRNLCQLAFSILQRAPEDEKVNHLVQNAFIRYIAYNYPGVSRELLDSKMEYGTETEQKVAKNIIIQMDSYYEAIINLPVLKEFMPPESRTEKFQKMKTKKWGREIQQAVHQKSVFMQLVHKIELKGGKSSFSKYDGQYTPKSPLAEQSVSMEFPRGEFLDPTGQAIDRLEWRACTREDI